MAEYWKGYTLFMRTFTVEILYLSLTRFVTRVTFTTKCVVLDLEGIPAFSLIGVFASGIENCSGGKYMVNGFRYYRALDIIELCLPLYPCQI